MATLLLPLILVVTLVVQAALPSLRLVIVLVGASMSCVASALLGVATTGQLLSEVPWDVIVILVGLGLVSALLVESRVFGMLAAWAARASRASPLRIPLLFAVAMYGVSGVVNNLTALMLVLPVLLVLLKLMGVTQRFVSWTLGVVIVACNLGGAATPIGDFPAILLLGRGSMTFNAYLTRALPVTAVALLIVLAALLVIRPGRKMDTHPLAAQLSVDVMAALYRGVRLDRSIFVPTAIVLVAMFGAWVVFPSTGPVTPELVCWVGAGVALLMARGVGERLVRTKVDAEAALFLLSLFVMVGAVRRAGVFKLVADALAATPLSPVGQLVVFLIGAALITGIFSAGPGMAALLDVAVGLTERLPAPAVFVGLAMAVCAGSSLFLTAATAGPLAQALCERAQITSRDGRPVRFGFGEHLGPGLLGFVVTLLVGIVWAVRTASA